MPLIAPSLLSADFLRLDKAVELVNAEADIFHIDVMDGVFVPNISFGFPVLEALRPVARKTIDVHLMITDPASYAERFAALSDMLSFHLEAEPHAAPLLDKIRSLGPKAGLVINPDCPVERLYPHIEHCDFVLIMSVFAGFGGQKFIESTYDRIAAIKEEIIRQGLNVKIEVDGGVTTENAAALAAAGADILVAGTSVFKAASPADAISLMRGDNQL